MINIDSVKIEHILTSIKRRQMNAFFFNTAAEAGKWIIQTVPKGVSVGWGDSLTLEATGVKEHFRNGPYTVYDRDAAGNDTVRKEEILRGALTCDWYLVGSNALTENGELLNIDGRGNRCASISFGPHNVIFTVGVNKIVKDLNAAIERVHKVACVANVKRHNLRTPCSLTGECSDCTVPDCACSQILITRFSRHPGRCSVLIIGEELGF
ncbi:MAG: lactate utilization protein [Clostridia bacterium]|nr:lactate utilization protein [Clostridia bacterium]